MNNLPNKEHTDAADLGTTLTTYPGHTYETGVLAVAWSPNGQRIASASNDDTVQVWQAI
jgi:WD40 repeat protein